MAVAVHPGVQRIFLPPANENEPARLPSLSRREQEVLVHVAQGLSNTRIAKLLGITASAVATHLARARRKLGERHATVLRCIRVLAQLPDTAPELTPAELEVTRLAREGLSNREIAERRGCSVNTVSNQLSSVYEKLGGASRRRLRAKLLEPGGLEQRSPRASAQRGSSRQKPFVHGTPLQQSDVISQACPYAEHVPPVPPVGVPPVDEPPVLDVPPVPVVPPAPLSGTSLLPQIPLVAPGRMEHGSPLQQSAVVVHTPPAATQLSAPQTNGGSPSGFGTQGRLQQSALDAHAWPT
jgi:DNA-binding CsgD family transcriptional regulator